MPPQGPNETVIARAGHSLAADKSPITLMLSKADPKQRDIKPPTEFNRKAAIRDNQGLYLERN